MQIRKLCTALLAGALLLAALQPARAADHYVPSECATIQQAIDDSASGDRILVAAGVYDEDVSILGKHITIRSETGNRDCTLRSIYVDVDGGLALLGFTLQSVHLGDGPVGSAAGIFRDCEFTGAGIWAEWAYLDVASCRFVNNAAISATSPDWVNVWSCTFDGSGGVDASGMIEAGGLSVDRCTFQGGSVFGRWTNMSVQGCTFEKGGGVELDASGYETFEVGSCRFTGPGQTAIHVYGEQTYYPVIDRVVVSGYRTGISLTGGEIDQSVAVGNQTGIYLDAIAGYVDRCTVAGNRYGIAVSNGTLLELSSTVAYGSDYFDLSGASEYWTTDCLVGTWDSFVWYSGTQAPITSDPRFARSPAPGPDGLFGTPDDDLGDVRLSPRSPAIDRGLGAPAGTDLDGNPRTYGKRSDIGAYELQGGTLSLYAVTPDTYLISRTGGLTVYGTGFQKGCVVWINGVAHATAFTSEFKVSTRITLADTAVAGVFAVTVSNPGGGASNALNFTVANPKPAILSLAPNAVLTGGPDFELTLTGARFVPGAVVLWKGAPRPTTFVSATAVKAQISAADIAAKGYASVTVSNPGPGGGVSNVKTFRIQ